MRGGGQQGTNINKVLPLPRKHSLNHDVSISSLVPENHVPLQTPLLLCPIAAELILCVEWRNHISWELLNATEHGPGNDPRNSWRNLHFEMTGNGIAMWQDITIHGPESWGVLLSLCILPHVPPSWLKKLTAVQNVFQSGIHCCPRGRAGCCLCAGPQWTYSRALICPQSSPQCFPRCQSQNWNKREMPQET